MLSGQPSNEIAHFLVFEKKFEYLIVPRKEMSVPISTLVYVYYKSFLLVLIKVSYCSVYLAPNQFYNNAVSYQYSVYLILPLVFHVGSERELISFLFNPSRVSVRYS